MSSFPKEVIQAITVITGYIANNYNPHTKIVIENGKIEIIESIIGFKLFVEPDNFLKC